MNSPDSQASVSRRALRDFLPEIWLEIFCIAMIWSAYFCRAVLGFDLLRIFHRGGPGSAREYFWIGICASAVAGGILAWKFRKARILQTRGVETIGTILETTRQTRGNGYAVKVAYTVAGKQITAVHVRDIQPRPRDNAQVTVVYDPQKPGRSWTLLARRDGH